MVKVRTIQRDYKKEDEAFSEAGLFSISFILLLFVVGVLEQLSYDSIIGKER